MTSGGSYLAPNRKDVNQKEEIKAPGPRLELEHKPR